MVQTGVQLLTGFLLALPFQQRFDVLSPPMRNLYLATVGCWRNGAADRPRGHASAAGAGVLPRADVHMPGWRCSAWC